MIQLLLNYIILITPLPSLLTCATPQPNDLILDVFVYPLKNKDRGVSMVLDLLSSIEKIKNKRGKSIIQSASDESIQNIKNWISSNVKKNVWVNEYENFLKIANGLNFNGLFIYNTNPNDDNNGFIAANEIWRETEWDNNYLFFGDSCIAWFCFDVDSHLF